jgi:ribosome maturation factor RimP
MAGETKRRLVAEIEAVVGPAFPDVEVVDLDVGKTGGTLTLYIDRPSGVDLDLCAAVSGTLDELRERYTLEVSSPGLDRRLRTAAHFAAALGRDVAVKLAAPRDGRSNYRGVVTAAGDDDVTLALASGGEARLPLREIATAHVVYDFAMNGGRSE